MSGRLGFGLYFLLAVTVSIGICALLTANTRYGTPLICAAFFFAGGFVHHGHIAPISADRVRSIYDGARIASGEPVEVTGTIVGGRETALDGFFVRLKVDSLAYRGTAEAASGAVRLFAACNTPEMAADYAALGLVAGSRIRVSTSLIRDDGFRDPGVTSRKTILDWQDIDATGTIKSPLLVENLGAAGTDLIQPVLGLRERLTEKFRGLFSPQAAGVLTASLLGNKHYLDKETADVFREGGTFHILVISGLHITFIGGLAAMLVAAFTRRRWIQFLASSGFLWTYTVAVGAEVPVVRASLMFSVLGLSYAIHRTGSLANALGACGLVLLAWRPADLFTPSFQLTFVSVSAIVLAAFPLVTKLRSIGQWTPSAAEPFPANVPRWLGRLCETLYWEPERWEVEAARNVWTAKLFKAPYLTLNRGVRRAMAYLFDGVLVSFIVQAAMLPLTVHYFHRVTPVSILTNLWAGAFIALESFAAAFAVAASSVSASLALPFVRLTDLMQWALVSVPGVFSDVRWLSFRVPVYARAEPGLYAAYLAFAAMLAAAAFFWEPFSLSTPRGRKALLVPGVGVACLAAVIILHPFSEPEPDGRLHVEFLDVGQGDSAFITFPNGETMLVDGGGRTSYRDAEGEPFEPDVPSIGEMVVSEFLWEKGHSHIDHVVGTHADADHIQGLADVAENFSVGQAWFGSPTADDPDQIRLESALRRHGVPIGKLARGDRMQIGGTLIEVLNPPAEAAGWQKENDRSVVLRLRLGSRTFLLTGDIEQLAESEIADPELAADVLKVPHHGSRTSSTAAFVDAVHPRFAVISVGLTSLFGHPHREVVERWRAAGAEVLTTGSEGAVSFSTDGVDLVASGFARARERNRAASTGGP